MIVRRPCVNDMEDIINISSNYDAPLVDRFESAVVAEFSGKVKAFGVIRHILEIVLYCDGSDREKVIAIKSMLENAKEDARDLGHDQLYVFVDNDFAKILVGKFGFREAQGKALILDL